MGIFARLRGIFNTRQTSDPRWLRDSKPGFVGRTLAGVAVTPDTALSIAAAWACLRYISQGVGMLPWHVMKKGAKGGETAPSHPIDYLLCNRPNPEWSSFQFRETLLHWALRWGNGYAEIERDVLGRAIALWPIHPDRVIPLRDPDTNVLYYKIHNGTLPPTRLEIMDMFHIRGFGDGPVGVNVVAYAAESLGWARAAQLFGAAFFGNGMNVNGVVQLKGNLDDVGLARLTAKLKKKFGGIFRAHEPLVLDNGSEWKATQVEPDKAQFIATNQHLVEEVARWFGVPLHKVGHLIRSTFSNIEQQSIEAVIDCLMPWAKRLEEEADYKLFGQNRPGLYTKMNFNSQLRGDSAARAAFYTVMRQEGVFSANDILRLEDMNTIGPEGDKRVMQSQYTTLEKIGEDAPEPVLPPAAPGSGKTDPTKPEPAADDQSDNIDAAFVERELIHATA